MTRAMTTITLKARSYRGERDLNAIADLINACEAVDKLDSGTSVTELKHEFQDPNLDKQKDICLWQDDTGRLIGYGEIAIPKSAEELQGDLWFRIHPVVRDSNLGKQIIAWGEQRLREVAQQRDLQQCKLLSGCRDKQLDQIKLFETNGFRPERYFFRMVRPLSMVIEEPRFPEGFILREVKSEDDRAWVEMFNQTFIDHWNHYDLTLEDYRYHVSEPNYRQDFNLIAVSGEGTFAAFCYCSINPQDNLRNGCNDGWIALLGTRRGFRHQGIGRAMLISGLQRLRAAGVDTAKLGVDADNPSGALQLYESVGFRKEYTSIIYRKELYQIRSI